MKTLNEIGKNSKKASKDLFKLSSDDKNTILNYSAKCLIENTDIILLENKKDVNLAIEAGIKGALIDRLTLTKERIYDMAEGLKQIAKLNDPIGEVLSMKTLSNGLIIGQKRVPMGVIGIIYEARPNVTSDAFGLCLKAGSSVILRGGKEAINSNKVIVNIFNEALRKLGYNSNIVQIVEDTQRESALEMMKLNKYIDLLIPRGGNGLIKSVVENSTVPVIETGVGNCHIFVDETAIIENAVNIVINAKTQRPGVCNACETLIVHENIAEKFIPLVCRELKNKNVEIRADKNVIKLYSEAVEADEKDWETEFLDYIIAVKTVKNIDEAIEHIFKYSTGHSECIVTENYTNAQRFLNEVDSAAVYVNASTRFTDGNAFGLGAEIGISTQKLHARGPMGLAALTTTKFIIYGNGQIRN